MFEYSVFEDMTLCTDAEVRRMLPLVSPQRREYALRFKHVFGQFAALKSYLMLCDLLHADSLPPFVYNDYGRPLLPDGPFFSISHTKDAVAVAVSDSSIGIDVESVSRHLSDSLVARTMNEREQEIIRAAQDPSPEFIALWTRKEAYLKYIGTGIVDDLKQVLCDVPADVCLRTKDYGKYILSLAYNH